MALEFDQTLEQTWMFSTSVKGNPDSKNRVNASYFFVRFNALNGTASKSIHERIKAALSTGESERNWALAKILSRLPKWLIVFLTAFDFRVNTKSISGLYTHLGCFKSDEERDWVWCAPIRRNRRKAVLVMEWNERIQISLHQEQLTEALLDALAERLLEG